MLVRISSLETDVGVSPILEFHVPIKGWGSSSDLEVSPWIEVRNPSLVLLWNSGLTSCVEVRGVS